MSTKSHTLPSSVFHGKENLILWKEDNKPIRAHLTWQGGGGGGKNLLKLCYVAHPK